jgi:cysteine desulfurase / selenocysteine lyase
MLDINKIRSDFPLLSKKIDHKPIIYLDSTATSLKPKQVIEKINQYYISYTANVFRGIYKISEKATAEYESARAKIAKFVGASDAKEIIFTRNTSESLNLVCASWAKNNLKSGDEIVTTILEHHSNFVPWQQMAIKSGIKLKIWYVESDGTMDYQQLNKLITRKTKLLTLTSMSNVLGTILDIKKTVSIVRKLNPKIVVMVDGAQSVPHMNVNVKNWGADFVAFSGHKMLGPTGIGALWGKPELLEQMEPYQYGGDMISEVHEDATVFNKIPHKFEAGTPHIAGAIGFGAAVDYLSNLGMENVREHEIRITDYAIKELSKIESLTIYGPKDVQKKGGVIAFSIKDIHPHDVAQILDEDNVCIRVGFHCAQPLHEYLNIGPTARASFYIYNTNSDVDALVKSLEKVKQIFK